MAQKRYNAPPQMVIDPNKRYMATFHTEAGDFQVELFAAQAPQTVNNFVFLARDGFYNNTTFHRWPRVGTPPVQARVGRAINSLTSAAL